MSVFLNDIVKIYLQGLTITQAVDLIGPVLGVIDSFVGVREKTCALYTYGFLLMRQQNLQEAR